MTQNDFIGTLKFGQLKVLAKRFHLLNLESVGSMKSEQFIFQKIPLSSLQENNLDVKLYMEKFKANSVIHIKFEQ